MKRLIPLALFALFLSGCGKDSPPAASSSTPAPSAAQPAATAPAPAAPATTASVEPQATTVFANQIECAKAGYGASQCGRAASTAAAMALADRPVYSTLAECKKLFAKCSGKDPKRPSYPEMVGFSIGDEPKTAGEPPAPSVEKPLWYAPIYQNAAGEKVFLKRTASGQVSAFPVAPKKKG